MSPRPVFLLLLSLAAVFSPAADERALVRELAVELRSGDKWVRKGAVQKLGGIGTPLAWEPIVAALEDRCGEVADTAQLILGGVGDPAILDLIDGKAGLRARDAWVRLRVVEALGRMPLPGAVERLLGALDDPDAEVRRAAAWSAERQARSGGLAELEEALGQRLEARFGRERDALVRARLLFALTAVRPAAARSLVTSAAGDRRPVLRCAAAAVAPELLAPADALGLLAALAEDPELLVRTQVVDSLAVLGTRAAVLDLVERLATEGEERLLRRTVEHLQSMSALKYRRDPRPWRDWAGALPEDWRVPAPAPVSTPAPAQDRSVAPGGLPILSGRFTLLIDLSGSIWSERVGGRTKKEVVDGKLREVLENLPVETLFNLIPYTKKPHPWQEELVRATSKNVRAAIRWFERLNRTGSGNFWDAAMLAIEDPAVDTLVVLTDGEPTGGRRYELELIVPLFLERNAMRKVAVDSVLVDASARRRRHWGELSARTGGQSVTIEL